MGWDRNLVNSSGLTPFLSRLGNLTKETGARMLTWNSGGRDGQDLGLCTSAIAKAIRKMGESI
jgi:hypothetical protein